MPPRSLFLGLLTAVISFSITANELPDLGDSSVANLPPHEEKRISEMTIRELRRSGEVLDDVEIADYLNRIGYKLVSASNENRIQFRFFPLLAPSINAWAVPGGVIGVNSGLLVLSQHESELAAVLAHEIAHVTQHHYARMVESQKGSGFMTLGAMALAILAASRGGSGDAPIAAVAASQGYQTQRYLDFSRDFEREADRVGMQTLQNAGFDVRAMPAFFDRMQKFYRNVDDGAFAFLRTHPVTSERISDSEARVVQQSYKQWVDSLDYLLVREKTRARQMGTPAVDYYAGTTSQKKYASEAAQQYGYAVALLQAGRFDAAWDRLALARKALPAGHAMLDSLAGNIRLEQGQYAEAAAIFSAGLERYPSAIALQYGELDVLLRQNKPAEVIALAEAGLTYRNSDAGLYKRLAEAHQRLNQTGPAHRAQAEYYALMDEPTAAIEQLQIARRAGGDFYQMSSIEARIRELREKVDEGGKK
ncbi:M48 family metalloprotease [Chitinimonas sp. PSY-7]|uniref:M48 family metalloprotease n=1 Tax=Chitinimonas sp. PSY-7 TaxID=3459088 RepID=UPI0040403548